MRIGVPKEIKNNENRVGLVTESAAELVKNGHEVHIETGAGMGAGISDQDYINVGAKIAPSADDIFANSEMVIKVKEPLASERKKLRKDQILFTYLHLAPDQAQTQDLINSGAVCIAYETVTANNGTLPLLFPMSEVAGRLAPQVGADCLLAHKGGSGVLLGGVPGVRPGKVVVLGGGVAGTNAAQIALGLGADVTIVDRSLDALRRLNAQFGATLKTAYSTTATVASLVADADLVVGTVLIPGAAAPKLVSKEMIKSMRSGSVVVDVSIDQGGCFETSRPSSHAEPTFVDEGVVHYCVTNMPGGVARTSTFALNNATLPFALALANKGWKKALKDDVHLKNGLNVCAGKVTYKAVAEAQGLEYVPADNFLN